MVCVFHLTTQTTGVVFTFYHPASLKTLAGPDKSIPIWVVKPFYNTTHHLNFKKCQILSCCVVCINIRLQRKSFKPNNFYTSDGRVVRVYICGTVERRPRFDYQSGRTNDFKVAIHSFPNCRSTLKGQCKEQVGKFTCVVEKGA